ncbi:MAG: S41 family peptidase [Bacteroidota bacterium]
MKSLLKIYIPLLSVILCGSAWSLVATPATGQNLISTTNSTGDINPQLHGIWQNPRKGWLLEIGNNSARLLNYTAQACIPDEMPKEALLGLLRFFERDGDMLQLSLRAGNSTVYHFDRLQTLPATCKASPEATPVATFNYFAEVMAAYYAFFDLYDVDWAQRREAFEKKVTPSTTDAALFDVFAGMLEGLKDGHLSLIAEVDGENKRFTPTRTRTLGPNLDELFYQQEKIKSLGAFHTNWMQENMRTLGKKVLNKRGQGSAADENIRWGKIGKTGYIQIRGMEGYAGSDDFSLAAELAGAHDAISKAIHALKDTESLIVDVAFNRGGLDEVSLALASHFADDSYLAYTKAAHGAVAAPQPFYVTPAASAKYLKPVALVTSQISVSAAEIFTLAMRVLPNVTHYGEATFGALSDILPKTLPNGWALGLSNEHYVDVNGEAWEGRGITPDKPVLLFDPDDIFNSYPRVLEQIASGAL